MALNIANESKNDLSISNEVKSTVGKWNTNATRTWADGGTWGQPGISLERESKISLSISNETKL